MSRRSQTEIAVLGGLSVEPMTGYALRQAITETLGHFWHESFGQIYPTLAALEASGLVRRTSAGQTSGSQFEITADGLARLRERLTEPIESAPPRNGLLLRLFFGRLLGADVCRNLIEAVQERAHLDLETFAQLRSEVSADPDPHSDYWLITIAAGEHGARAQLEWAHEALEILARQRN
jgi:DNA-binding PadR family transcriptional regulator